VPQVQRPMLVQHSCLPMCLQCTPWAALVDNVLTACHKEACLALMQHSSGALVENVRGTLQAMTGVGDFYKMTASCQDMIHAGVGLPPFRCQQFLLITCPQGQVEAEAARELYAQGE
jgi:hypothetical protein